MRSILHSKKSSPPELYVALWYFEVWRNAPYKICYKNMIVCCIIDSENFYSDFKDFCEKKIWFWKVMLLKVISWIVFVAGKTSTFSTSPFFRLNHCTLHQKELIKVAEHIFMFVLHNTSTHDDFHIAPRRHTRWSDALKFIQGNSSQFSFS